MENSECPPTRPDKDEGGHCKHTLISIVSFMGWPFMYGADLWLVLLCTVSFRADLGHSANSAYKWFISFDVKCLQDQ